MAIESLGLSMFANARTFVYAFDSPELKAHIFTQQSVEPLKTNLSLSGRSSSCAAWKESKTIKKWTEKEWLKDMRKMKKEGQKAWETNALSKTARQGVMESKRDRWEGGNRYTEQKTWERRVYERWVRSCGYICIYRLSPSTGSIILYFPALRGLERPTERGCMCVCVPNLLQYSGGGALRQVTPPLWPPKLRCSVAVGTCHTLTVVSRLKLVE